MKNFFSYVWYGREAPREDTRDTDTGHVINDSIDTIDSLTMKRAQYLAKADDAFNKAKKLPATEKTKRLQLMKQRQGYQHQADMYAGMISNKEQTAQSLDTAAVTLQLAKTMKAAQLQMKDQMGLVQVEDIDAVADDLEDTMRDVNDMAAALARPIGMGETPDDDELLGELDQFDAANVELPTAPVGKVSPLKARVPSTPVQE